MAYTKFLTQPYFLFKRSFLTHFSLSKFMRYSLTEGQYKLLNFFTDSFYRISIFLFFLFLDAFV